MAPLLAGLMDIGVARRAFRSGLVSLLAVPVSPRCALSWIGSTPRSSEGPRKRGKRVFTRGNPCLLFGYGTALCARHRLLRTRLVGSFDCMMVLVE